MPSNKIFPFIVGSALAATAACMYAELLLPAFVLSGFAFGLLVSQLSIARAMLNPMAAKLARQTEKVEEKLTLSENRYEVLVSNIAALIVIKNQAGKILFASPYSVVLTGHPSKDLTSEIVQSLIPESHSELFLRAYKIAALGEPFSFQHPLKHRSGVTVWVDSRIAPIEGPDGSTQGTLTIMLDATATARYQHQIEAYASELRDVSSMISHDLKSPIATIRGMTHVLESERKCLGDEGQEALDHISHATNSMELLVKEILSYFKSVSDDITQESVNLFDVCEAVRADVKGLLTSVKGSVTIQESTASISSDRVKLYQIISNLVSNGLKYQSEGRVPAVTITLLENPASISLLISDNGAGIPQEKISHIFRPYVRLPGVKAEGHGLGLATVKKLVERLKGTIEVESTVGSGSTFRITFPRE